MMAGLFLILLIAMGFAITGKRKMAITLFYINLALMLLMLWHHMTDKLNLNF